jgi:inner membrane protein
MEPVTHFLTGACIGRAGLNRKTAYATLAAVLAAEAADIDVLWGWAGPVEGLKHHRGITHTFLAVPVVAAAAVGIVWLFDRWWERRRRRRLAASQSNEPGSLLCTDTGEFPGKTPEKHPSEAKAHGVFTRFMYGLKPVPFNQTSASLTQTTVLFNQTSASDSAPTHLLLDWTNNYGLRPFFPFNPRWYEGSIVFIAEPVLWALLGAAMVVPWLLGLVGGEIGVRRQRFRGRGWAIFALTGMVLLWGWRWAEQGRARMLVENTAIAAAPVTRTALEPYPLNPFRWHAILETDGFYQTAEINTHTGEIVSDSRRDVIYKPPETAAVEAAKRTLLGRIFLDWGAWAVVRDVGQVSVPGLKPPDLPPNRSWTAVEFTDLRFDYSFLGTGGSSNQPALGGWVYIVDRRDDAGEVMNGREQR